MLDLTPIKAITLDLDDTLWPIWPTIEKADLALHDWLVQHAPQTAALLAQPAVRHEIREHVNGLYPELRHDLSTLRTRAIRLALSRSGNDPGLAEAAFEVFFDARHQVTLFDDALQSLQFLSRRMPLVALSNGNADVHRIGIGSYFTASLSAQQFGVGKPDPRIFHAAASAVGLQAHEVLHVGDDAELDVLAALDCGMQTVWVNRSDHPWAHRAQPHEIVTTLTELCALFPLEPH
ncbi:MULTISPECIES: HAD family hydrolase [unclassified Polaromonas]|uniref:HAD family hydrolase n=1 Tax=unclassified Polaromonas TaxID=2638319 RepID=UPI0018C9CEF0|nr:MULTISPECIES: HAD-IA family hydrolase [unclassified Polaromonas]MBG6071143.1 putative hydrolase of the HAD superfamily [Polaromonas sp. CG_9.7]MBG6113143.1 putative hydrolase of the HAD superfamily [Polaromonas sp. CG_9.2]